MTKCVCQLGTQIVCSWFGHAARNLSGLKFFKLSISKIVRTVPSLDLLRFTHCETLFVWEKPHPLRMQVERFKILNVGWVGPSNFVYVYTSWRWRGVESKAPCRLPCTSSKSQKSCTDFMVFLQNVATPEHDIPTRGISPAFYYFDVFVFFLFGFSGWARCLVRLAFQNSWKVTTLWSPPPKMGQTLSLRRNCRMPTWCPGGRNDWKCWSEECCKDRTS